jgi:hypothetical protein
MSFHRKATAPNYLNCVNCVGSRPRGSTQTSGDDFDHISSRVQHAIVHKLDGYGPTSVPYRNTYFLGSGKENATAETQPKSVRFEDSKSSAVAHKMTGVNTTETTHQSKGNDFSSSPQTFSVHVSAPSVSRSTSSTTTTTSKTAPQVSKATTYTINESQQTQLSSTSSPQYQGL